MSIIEKIKAINNKIERNKAQYNLDRHTAKISALLSGNISKNEFLTGKYVFKKYKKSNLIYSSKYSFYKNSCDSKKPW